MDRDTDTLPLGLDIAPLTPARAESTALQPETEVLCIHRGREVLEDMFDSVPYRIEPGHFYAPFAGAKHFQTRLIVPGSRNPETKAVRSFIGIIGLVRMTAEGIKVVRRVDAAPLCEPFTDEECAEMSLAVEGLDRKAMVNPIVPADKASVVPVSAVRGISEGAGAVMTRGGDRIVTEPDALAAPPPDQHEGIAAAAADRAGQAAERAQPEPAAAAAAPTRRGRNG